MSFPLAWLEALESKGLIAPTVKSGPPIDCLEKELQAEIVELATANGWKVFHVYDSRRSESGWPDLAFVRGNRFFLAELKREKKKPTKEQNEWIDALRFAGVCVYVWRPSSWSDIVEILR